MANASPLIGGTLCLDFINSVNERDWLPPGESIALAERGRVTHFREAMRRLFSAEALGAGASSDDVETLNRVLAHCGARRGLVSTVRGYGWGWLDNSPTLDRTLWPVAFSAARLLEGTDLVRLKACDSCGRLFLDRSRNRSRRWCDMQGCGNRAKVARHRARKD